MWMTEKEIARSYRDAPKKGAQIGILADLNLCTKAEIQAILVKMGEIQQKEKKKVVVKASIEENAQGVKTVKNEKAKIPDCIAEFAFGRLDQIEKEIEVYNHQIKELEVQYNEITEFLNGTTKEMHL